MTFKVGDKVMHAVYGTGEVAFGPFSTDTSNFAIQWYVVDYGATHKILAAGTITAVPAFAVGDTVRYDDQDVTVRFGPFTSLMGTDRFLVELADGCMEAVAARYLSTAPAATPLAVGDKIRILVGDPDYDDVSAGDVLTVSHVYSNLFRVTDGWTFEVSYEGTGWERVTDMVTVDGVTYYLSARYIDRDGDVWRLGLVDGTVRVLSANNDRPFTSTCHTLKHVARTYGPLARERVTDMVTVDGVTYDLSARYEDEDGHAWRLRLVDGVARATTSCALVFPDESSMTLSHAARTYGPLTKVAD